MTLAAMTLGACGFGVPAIPAPTGANIAGASNPPTIRVSNRTGFSPGSGILWMPDADRMHELQMMAATGARWISLDIDWASIQGGGPTSFNWSTTDTVVREARSMGFKILGMIAYSPTWARPAAPACPDTHCLPVDPSTYAAVAAAAAHRYGSTSTDPTLRNAITSWQIWNEPNHGQFVKTVNVAAYTTLLKASYTAIKASDPGAAVITGGTSPAPDNLPFDMKPATFLQGIYDNGGKGYFDAVSHHPYTFPYGPYDDAPWNAFTQTLTLRDIMVAHGDSAKKIWGTEAGLPTTARPGVTTAEQVKLMTDYFTAWNGSKYLSWTGPLFWFQIRDSGTNPNVIDQNFGLLYRNFTPKPAYAVFKQQVRRLI